METYTGDEGTEALAAGMDVMDGTEDRRNGWLAINKARDYIVSFIADLWPLTVARGGTGANNAATARTNLGIPGIAAENSAEAGKLPIYNSTGQLTSFPPALGAHVATKAYVDGQTPPQQLTDGGTFLRADGKNLGTTGDLFASGSAILYGASAATSGWTQAYIDGNGRVSKGASSERYKKYISTIDAEVLGDVWPDLVRYQMRGGDGSWRYGYIAERLAEHADQQPFVVYKFEPNEAGEYVPTDQPDSIDFISLLMVQNAQLHARLSALEARVSGGDAP